MHQLSIYHCHHLHIYFCYRDFEVYCENKLVAIATSKWVLFDFKCNRITKLTDEIYNPYEPEDTHVFENEEKYHKEKIKIIIDFDKEVN